jgi:hypothetical protein
MKKIYILLTFGIVLSFASCYKPSTWVDENVKQSQGYYPVIQAVRIANVPTSGKFAVGDVVKFEMKYWSVDPISKYDLYAKVAGTETLYSSTPYVYSFKPEIKAELIILEYTVPQAAAGTTVELKAIVTNENGLTRTSAVVKANIL